MDLSTRYLGFTLTNPLVVGAGPIAMDLGQARAAEDAGAAALVMHSIFEEQITRESLGSILDMDIHNESFAEALSYFPEPAEFKLGPDAYLERVQKLKAAVGIPVIASLNALTPAGWTDYAAKLQQAGADALELNVYSVPTDAQESGQAVEERTLDVVKAVKGAVSIPVIANGDPYYSSMTHFSPQVEAAGADALVLFNRFYQPDIDIEELEVRSGLELSSSWTLRMRLRWLAVLYGVLRVPMAATGGVHTPEDVIKALMAGATVTQLTSALLKHGPGHLKGVLAGLDAWLEEHEYESLAQLRGSMSLQKSPNPQAFWRANYMRLLSSWRG